MRWLKHLAYAHNDRAMAAITEQFGAEGYGIYWLILEHLAIVIEKESEAIPSAIHSIIKWSQICHCSTRTFVNFCNRAAELKLIESRTQAELKQNSSRTQAERLQIDVPKLLKYRDEWSKRSGVTPRSSATHTHTEENTPKAPAAKPAACEPKDDPISMHVLKIAKRIAARHPTFRCNLSEVAIVAKLHLILKRHAKGASMEFKNELLNGIDEWHAELCKTPQWTKENGEYSQGLEKFLAPTLDRYLRPANHARQPELWVGYSNGAPNPGLVGGDD